MIFAVAAMAAILANLAYATPEQGWQRFATEYRDADSALDMAPTDQAIASILERRAKAAARLIREPAPSEDELLALLQSSEDAKREWALVAVIARRQATAKIVQALTRTYQPNASFFSRFYALEALSALPREQTKAVDPEVVAFLLREGSEAVRLRALVYLAHFQPAESVPVFALYMRTGPPSLQRATYSVVRSGGAALVLPFMTLLNKEGARDALKAIEQIEQAAPR